jgi:hypothetical protein
VCATDSDTDTYVYVVLVVIPALRRNIVASVSSEYLEPFSFAMLLPISWLILALVAAVAADLYKILDGEWC